MSFLSENEGSKMRLSKLVDGSNQDFDGDGNGNRVKKIRQMVND